MTQLPGLPGARAPLTDALQEALALFRGGQFEAAEAAARQFLTANPKHGEALNLLGGIALERGDAEAAAAHLEAAARHAERNPFIWFNLGRALRRTGAPVKALQKFRKAAALKPDFAEAHGQMGETLRGMGQIREAEQAYRAALRIQPNMAAALNGLGLIALGARKSADAVACFQAAIAASAENAPGRATLYANLGQSLLQQGEGDAARLALLAAYLRAPDQGDFARALARSLRHVKEAPEHTFMRDALIALLTRDDVNPRSLATAALSVLRRSYDFAAPAPELFADELFLALLHRAPIPDADLEAALRGARAKMLAAAVAGGAPTFDLEFACALALQCHLNEFVYFVSAEEEALLAQLALGEDWRAWAASACYRPLDDEFPRSTAPEAFAPLVRAHLDNPERERALAQSVRTLKPLEDDVSRAVQAQYEGNPYPRWTGFDRTTPRPLREIVRQMLPHLSERELPDIAAPRVLLAGCGTGQETMGIVSAYAGATVLALDLSRASIGYGMRKLAEYGVEGVEHVHGDILDLGLIEERFDLVHSFGVIHHMREPERGMAALSARLKQGGLARIGIYSEIGRASVVAGRACIAERGYTQDASGLRAARNDMMRENDPALAPLMSPASDFWTASDCRDLIFHVNEHRYTLPQIGAMLGASGLEFLGLEVSNPADALAFSAAHPDPQAARSIDAWHAFETAHPDAFGNTYRIWARKVA